MLLLTYTHMMNRSIESTESPVSLFCVYAIFFFTRITITFILNLYILIKQAFYWVLNQSWTIKRHAYLMTNTFTGSTVIRKKNQGKENSVENETVPWFLMH